MPKLYPYPCVSYFKAAFVINVLCISISVVGVDDWEAIIVNVSLCMHLWVTLSISYTSCTCVLVVDL